jgi:ATP-dependent Clp protease ATP-binding subunit ClpA
VGDPGVGKTSIAEGLAWLIVNGKAPKPLANAEVYSWTLVLWLQEPNIVVTLKNV